MMSYYRCPPAPDLALLLQNLTADVLSNIWKMLIGSTFKGEFTSDLMP